MSVLDALADRARKVPRRVLFPEGDDPRVLEAVSQLQRDGLLNPVVLGVPEAVHDGILACGGDPGGVEVLDRRVLGPEAATLVQHLWARRRSRGMTEAEAGTAIRDPLLRATALLALDRVDGVVAGAVASTADVLRAALWCVGPADGVDVVSSSFYMILPGTPERVLTFTDAAVVPEPTAPQLAQIARAACRARRAIFDDSPVVAFLSYSTRGSADGPSVQRVRDAVRRFRDMEPGTPADGEFQVDTALVPEVSRVKAPDSAVGGAANVLVFPSLDAGNIGYKLVERLAGARALGPILQGLRRPVNDLSRGATAADIAQVGVITALQRGPL